MQLTTSPALMQFGSDNWAGAHPTISASLTAHAPGFSVPYSEDELDHAVERQLSAIFEHDVKVFYVATGTAANALALTCVAKPGGIVFGHRESHIIADECGAPEFLSGQLRLAGVAGKDGKMEVGELRKQVERFAGESIHWGRPVAVSLTQSTESGSVYSLEELDGIAAVARQYKLPLHMDGARFANALVSLSCTPAEMTWKRGVDILSFGATKNGCWCAEAVVFFNTSMGVDFPFVRKRAGQLFSKSRFVSAQFDAYLRDGLWLELARHANKKARELAEVFESAKTTKLIRQPQSNEVFVIMDKKLVAKLEEAGVSFHEWPNFPDTVLAEDERTCRFVASFATVEEDVMGLRRLIEKEL